MGQKHFRTTAQAPWPCRDARPSRGRPQPLLSGSEATPPRHNFAAMHRPPLEKEHPLAQGAPCPPAAPHACEMQPRRHLRREQHSSADAASGPRAAEPPRIACAPPSNHRWTVIAVPSDSQGTPLGPFKWRVTHVSVRSLLIYTPNLFLSGHPHVRFGLVCFDKGLQLLDFAGDFAGHCICDLQQKGGPARLSNTSRQASFAATDRQLLKQHHMRPSLIPFEHHCALDRGALRGSGHGIEHSHSQSSKPAGAQGNEEGDAYNTNPWYSCTPPIHGVPYPSALFGALGVGLVRSLRKTLPLAATFDP